MELNPEWSERAKEDYFLVERARAGDQKAYSALLQRYREAVHYSLMRMVHNTDDAEDLTIEAFGKAFINLDKYTPDYAFSTWLFKIAVNNGIDFIRKKKLKTQSLDDEFDAIIQGMSERLRTSVPDPEEQFIREQRIRLVREILNALSPKYKLLVELRYLDELSYEEIAVKLQMPLGTVKATLFRARDILYDILRDRKEKI